MPVTPESRPKPHPTSGFSLIELLVVLAIMALLAGLVAPKVIGYLGRAKAQTATSQIEGLRGALDLYLLDVGRYPETRAGLGALLSDDGRSPGWNGPYLREPAVPADPWGNAYGYELTKVGEPLVFSLGSDGAPGGEGDAADLGR